MIYLTLIAIFACIFYYFYKYSDSVDRQDNLTYVTVWAIIAVIVFLIVPPPATFILEDGKSVDTYPLYSFDPSQNNFNIGMSHDRYFTMVQYPGGQRVCKNFYFKETDMEVSNTVNPYVELTTTHYKASKWWNIIGGEYSDRKFVLVLPEKYTVLPLTSR